MYIYEDFGSGNVYGRDDDDLSIVFESYLLAPVTGTYTFYWDADDGVRLSLGGVSADLISYLEFTVQNNHLSTKILTSTYPNYKISDSYFRY